MELLFTATTIQGKKDGDRKPTLRRRSYSLRKEETSFVKRI
jgi:hypothetical protein